MALPQPNPNELVNEVNAAIGNMTPAEIGALPSIDGEDLALFGRIVQAYSFLDLNMRRTIEVMHLAKRLPKADLKGYPDYKDADLARILRDVVKTLDPNVEQVDELVFRLEEVGRCRGYRNLVGHFAAKRFPDKEVFVFASKSDRDARKATGASLKQHGVHFAVTGRQEFFKLADLLEQHQTRIALLPAQWDERYVKTGEAAG